MIPYKSLVSDFVVSGLLNALLMKPDRGVCNLPRKAWCSNCLLIGGRVAARAARTVQSDYGLAHLHTDQASQDENLERVPRGE